MYKRQICFSMMETSISIVSSSIASASVFSLFSTNLLCNNLRSVSLMAVLEGGLIAVIGREHRQFPVGVDIPCVQPETVAFHHTSEEMTRVYLKDFDVSMLNQVNRIVTNLSK